MGLLVVGLLVGGVLAASGLTMDVYPSGLTLTNWTLAGTAATALDTNDGGTTRIYSNTAGGTSAVALDNPTIPANTLITSVDVYVAANCETDDDLTVALRLGGTTSAATAVNVPQGAFNAVTYPLQPVVSFAVAPDGSAWGTDWSAITNLDVILGRVTIGTADYVRVTQLYVRVNYENLTSTLVTLGNDFKPPASYVTPGQTNVAVDAFTLQRTAGNKPSTAQINTITITSTGTPASTVSAVDVYRDVNANGLIDAGDVKVNSVSGTFSGSSAVVTINEPVSTTLGHYLVAYTFAAGATDNSTVNSNITAATYTNIDTLTESATTASTFRVDAANPAAVVSAPAASAVVTITPTTLQGTATDSVSGVATVQFTLRRLDTNEYWDGASGWQAGVAWLSTTLGTPNGTNTTWSRSWDLPAQNATFDYQLIARATDGVGRQASSAARTFRVDTVRPAISSAVADDNTHVTVNFTDSLNAASVAASDFAITGGAGLSVSDVSIVDADTVQLTTSSQVFGTTYTVTCAAGTLADPNGNTNALTSTTFSGFAQPKLTITAGPGRPAVTTVKPGDSGKVVDQLRLSATDGALTVTTLGIIGLDTAAALQTDISAVKLYADNGDGVFDGGVDTQVGATSASPSFSSQVSGTGIASFTGLSVGVAAGGYQDVWVVYDIAAGAVSGHRLGSRMTAAGVTVSAPAVVTAFAQIDSPAAGQTLVIDGQGPAVVISQPTAGAMLTGNPGDAYSIQGTAADSGSSVMGVEIAITDDSGHWWNGAAWVLSETWLPASDTSGGTWATWSRSWSLPSDSGATAYTVQVGARDAAGNQTISSRAFNVDTLGPLISSVNTVDATHVDVVFSEALTQATVAAGDFTITGGAGLTVSGVVFPNATTVRLTVSPQVPNTIYTVACLAGVLADSHGVMNAATSRSFSAYGSAGDLVPPTSPGTPSVAAGASSPTIAALSWVASTDNVAVTGYRVWRSTLVSGPFVEIGSGAATSFNDGDGVPGQDYYYRITAFDAAGNESAPSGVGGPVAATWTIAPHDVYTASTRLCDLCHVPHQAAPNTPILSRIAATTNEVDVCYVCHDGSGSSTNIAAGTGDTFAGTLRSGHAVEATSVATAADLTNVCSDCHTPHGEWEANGKLPAAEVNGKPAGSTGNTWCLKCHDDAAAWYKPGGYGTLITNPTKDATGYPIVGTFPGATTYATPTSNAHAKIPAGTVRETGDCLYCHTAHRSANAYDGLVATFTPSGAVPKDQTDGDFAALCFTCHGGGAWETSGAANVKQFITAGTQRSGHRIKTAGGKYAAGAPLPCYECHNPHGSSRGNAFMLSDALGGSLDPTATAPAGVRAFCFTCHTTSDSAKGWDSSTATYTTAVAAGKKVAGISRDAALGANVLRLADVSGHRTNDAQSCYLCHGSSYASGGNNVHSPSGGVSTGGSTCYGCHSAYQSPMDRTGSSRTSSYHHVMGTATTSGDIAPFAGSYPTTSTDVFCVSCHTDHNYFNASQSGNLRRNAKVTSGASPVDTDYLTTSADKYGVCISCHEVSLVKEVAGLQKSDGTADTDTPKIVGGTGSGGYGASAHSYAATSTYGDNTTFKADCSKCHNDEQAKEFQTAGNQFGTHWSNSQRLLSALGGSQTDYLGEDFCYRCHSSVYNPNAGTAKDAYGVRAMTTTGTLEVYEQFTIAGGSRHPVSPNGGSAVACENCHNPHVVSATGKITDPATGYAVDAYATVADKAAFCLTCHDGTLPVRDVSATTYVPVSVTVDGARAAQVNKATNATRAHWSASGSFGAGSIVACGTCHDNHGSRASKLLGAYNAVSGVNEIVGRQQTVTITANNNTVCSACHTSATQNYTSGYVRDAAGYPTDRTYPGLSVYENGTYGIHRNVTGGGESVGSCNNCHDVHGTGNVLDEVRGTFSASNFSACFGCHDGSIAGATNIKQFFPTTSGGSATQSGAFPSGTRFGHRVRSSVSGATLAQDEAVPCYDCHNPHGSGSMSGLYVVAATGFSSPNVIYTVIGDNEVLDTSSATGVRRFCFVCHTTYDNSGQGWNGSAMAVVPGGAAFEGIDRVNTAYKLRLPAANGHNLADTKNCYDCHGSNYGVSGSNVHNPTGGVSSGGQDCYGCHGSYSAMDDQVGTYKGSLTTYHHVLGSSTTIEGDEADQFWQSNYPAAGVNVYCLSCHVDHDKFNANKGANLRGDMTVNPTAAASDYNVTNGGVCLGCHSVLRAKDLASQATSGSANTPAIASAAYDASPHQYPVGSTFSGGSAFNADCAKCHNDEQTKDYQNSAYKFGTHWSAENRLLKALGAANAAPSVTEENLCFKCHSNVGTIGPDGYGVGTMSAASRGVQTKFSSARTHPTVSASGDHELDEPASTQQASSHALRHAECEDCHDPHEAQAGLHAQGSSLAGRALKGAWGIKPTFSATNWTAPSVFTTVTMDPVGAPANSLEGYMCLKCHSTYGGAISGNTTSGSPRTNLALEFNPANAGGHAVLGASKADSRAYGSYIAPWTSSTAMTCTDCHASDTAGAAGPHGSAQNWILRWPFNPANDGNGGSTSTTFCLRCHNPKLNTASGLTSGATGFANSSTGQNLHANRHNGAPCADCHILPPHGWQTEHLLKHQDAVVAPYSTLYGTPDYIISSGQAGAYRAWSGQHSGDCVAPGCG
ncbi:MAG: cytochrome c3 family protein [Coriobacteriia bacterium]